MGSVANETIYVKRFVTDRLTKSLIELCANNLKKITCVAYVHALETSSRQTMMRHDEKRIRRVKRTRMKWKSRHYSLRDHLE